jgi:hypothetical protein
MISRNLALAATRRTAENFCSRICKLKAKLDMKIAEDECYKHPGERSHWRKTSVALFYAWQRSHFVARGNNTGCHFTL